MSQLRASNRLLKKLTFWSIFFSGIMFPLTIQGDVEPNLRRQFEEELPLALSKLEFHLSRLQGHGFVKDYIIKNTNNLINNTSQFEITKDLEPNHKEFYKFWLDGKKEKAIVARQSKTTGKLVDLAWCIGENYSFVLKRPVDNSKYSVMSYGENLNLTSPNSTMEHMVFRFVKAPFSIFHERFNDLMNDTYFKIKDIMIKESIRNNKIMKIEFDCQSTPQIGPRGTGSASGSGWVEVSPERLYSIQAFGRDLIVYSRNGSKKNIKNFYAGEIEYRQSSEGVPLPKRVLLRNTYADGSIRDHIFEFESLNIKEIPKEEFTLAAFGLPELGKPTQRTFLNHTAYWLIGAALIALVIAVFLRVWGSRLERN